MRARLAFPLLAALALPACDGQEPPPAPLGAVPTLGREAVGPQPGEDHPLGEGGNPYADDPAAPAEGRRLFRWMNCEGCHGGRAGGGMGPSLRDPVWRYGGTEREIFNSIAQGRAYGMPAWGTKLPPDQIWKLVAYVRSLGTRSEPDPPPPNRSWPDPPEETEHEQVVRGRE